MLDINFFNVAATLAGVWIFIQNFWFVLLMVGLWLVARKNSRDKGGKENTLHKHLPTKIEVFNMLSDLFLK